jgi:hypothetical protein
VTDYNFRETARNESKNTQTRIKTNSSGLIYMKFLLTEDTADFTVNGMFRPFAWFKETSFNKKVTIDV